MLRRACINALWPRHVVLRLAGNIFEVPPSLYALVWQVASVGHMRHVLLAVAEACSVSVQDLKRSMIPRHVSARRAAAYVLRTQGASYGEIALILEAGSRSSVRRLYLQALNDPDPRISYLL